MIRNENSVEFLRQVDSPTVANAIERLNVRDRCEGFLGGAIRAMFPDLGVMVGYALTVTMESRSGPVADREGHWRMWDALVQNPRPSIVVIKDLNDEPTRCAYFGEVMATIAKACGAVGIVCDGGVRDLNEVRALGLHYFAPYAVVSHGNFRIVDVGTAVNIDGQRVETGDLLHGDINGIVIVPPDCLEALPAAIEQIRTRERKILDYARQPGFTLDGLRKTGGY